MEKIECKLEVQYNGHDVKKGGNLNLNFLAPYSEIANSLRLTRMINSNITVDAKIGKNKPVHLGIFMLWNLSIDHSGESKIKFNSMVDNAEIDNFIALTEKETIIMLRCSATVLDEEDDVEAEDDDEDEDE